MLAKPLAAYTYLSSIVSELYDRPPRLGGFPSGYRHPVWHGKTRMSWLPGGEKILKISLFILTQLTNVTDTHTERHTDTACRHIPRLCISRGKNCSGCSDCSGAEAVTVLGLLPALAAPAPPALACRRRRVGAAARQLRVRQLNYSGVPRGP